MRFLPKFTPLTIARLRLQPGDRLIVTASQRLSAESADRIAAFLRTKLRIDPEVNPIVIMDGSVTVQVLSAEDGDLS